jgi:cation diffusion facilitator CzcD-associated flavoprotein CzcO
VNRAADSLQAPADQISEPNPDYSRYYVGGVEIHAYLKSVAQKHSIEKYIKYDHRLVTAIWNEVTGKWDLEIETIEANGEASIIRRSCHVLLNASGLLNNWKWPKIPGLESFKGHLCHSARWQHDYDWKDKKIAIIGSGSSAIQIVPELQPLVKEMKAFIRSPTWIAPSQGFVDPENGEGPKNFHYTAEEKKKFRADPEEFLRYRKKIESDMNKTFETMLRQSKKQIGARKAFAEIMKQRLNGDEVLAEKLTPKWSVGCRRLTPGQNFLESLVKENVEVVSDEIDRIDADGLVTAEGRSFPVDAIVCATGFDTTYRPRFRLQGRKGVPLSELWKHTDDVVSYLAVAVPDFPNYFSKWTTTATSAIGC